MRHRIPTVAAILLAFAAGGVMAQDALSGRLDAPTATAVRGIIAGATAEGLPAEPLRNKALEGASKGADGARIVTAVEQLLGRLREGRVALGGNATTAELVSAAAVLDLGVAPKAVSGLRAARPDEPLASALVGLAFLVQRGASVDGSVTLVREMLDARASDADFARFRELVDQDVRAGAPIGNAARARARAFTRSSVRPTSGTAGARP
jgi:hypothetical protein